MRYAALALALGLLAACCAAQRVGPQQDKPAAWDATTRTRAQRLALYGRALRCKWPRVATWSCIDCSAVTGTTILAHWLAEGYAPDDAPDAFTIHNDSVLRALVVTFRSTYTNPAGWLSNLDGIGVYRKVNGHTFLLHKGFSSSYYSTIRPALLERLAAIRATGLANARTVYLHGHSRGAAHAMLAAVDLATDGKAALNITRPFQQIKLYNFGSSRVGDKAYAEMTESLIGERFRIANSGDPVPHLPPTSAGVVNANKLVTDLVSGVASTISKLPSWLRPEIPDLSKLVGVGYNYWHFGPHILQLDYIDANGLAVQRTAALGNELVCQESDLDKVCLEESLRAAGSRTRRPSVGPYAALSATGAPMNRWPLFNFQDHGWYMGLDMENTACQNMKPAGWWGWKMAVGTSTARGSGTDGTIRARWSCDGQAATNGWLPLDCKFTLGDALDGNWEKLNCFERGDYNTFAWQHNNLTSKDGNALLPQHRVPGCFAAGGKPVLALEHRSALDDWKVESLILQLAYTQGPKDKIVTRWFGDCTAGIEDPLTFPKGTSKIETQLCPSDPWYHWTLKVRTGSALGAGTDGDVSVSWRCGDEEATNGFVALQGNAVGLTRKCGLLGNCFERASTDTFRLAFDPGRWDPAGALTPKQFPVPACTAPGVQPELTLSFKGNGQLDAWDLDLSGLVLELSHMPDETSLWDEKTGSVLAFFQRHQFKPCTGGISRFARTATAVQRTFKLCPVTGAKAASAGPVQLTALARLP